MKETLGAALHAAAVAALTMSECAAESLVGEEGEAVVEVRDGDVTQHFVDEGVLQEQACFRFGNAALTHIKQSSLVQLSGCGAVVTTYVVGIDFQHGLRESARGRRGTKAGVGLAREGFVGTGCHIDLPGESTDAAAVQHIFI